MSIRLGQAGEYLTAGFLINIGLQVMVSPTEGADLLAFDVDRYWRVEVKTSATPEKEKPRYYRFSTTQGSRKKRRVSSAKCDIIALCALPLRRTIFRHVNQVRALNVRVPVSQFVEGCERRTWEAAITWT